MNALPPEHTPTRSPTATLCLRLFGPFSASVHGEPMPKTRSRKEAWLLALLALRAHTPLERSWLADVLWPDALGEAALYNLRRSLHGLREALGPEADRLFAPTPRTLRLDLDGADCDLTAFDADIRRGDPESLVHAAALYSGPLLLGCLEEWALPEREARERAVLGTLETLAAGARARGDLSDAAARLERALEIAPLRETALRGLMEALADQGSHTAAAEIYRVFRLRLRAEMNAEPDPATVTLHQNLRARSRQPAPPAKTDVSAGPSLSPVPPSHLPTPLMALIGRVREIEAVSTALDGARLVTLTGTGGVGKTRLALAVAHKLHDEFPEGAWFADLSALADPKLMTQAVLGALGGREGQGRSPSEALTEFLRPKRLLLVLDNCEHLVSACAYLAQALLQEAPALRILATSREALGIIGEVQWRVPSLSLPGDRTDDAESEAVRLFVERARGVKPGWTPSASEQGLVADICRRLDGIPLAIEMAAARTRALSVEGVAARLDDAFRLLAGQGGGLVPRQQTLRAALDWSWDLLAPDEQTLLAGLSVFAGGWTLEAAEAVCADDSLGEGQVLDVLTRLIDKSLVVYEEREGIGRYRLLETVRQYAREKRGQDSIGGRHVAYFLALAEAAEVELTGSEQAAWLARLETEHDNLRAALSWCRSQGGPSPGTNIPLMRLAGALTHFWWIRGHQREGRMFLTAALEQHDSQAPDPARLKGLRGAAILAQSQGGYNEAKRLYEEALGLARQLDDRTSEADLLGCLAGAVGNMGDHATAKTLLEEALALNRGMKSHHQVAANLAFLGYITRLLGDAPAARALLTEAVAISRKLGDLLGVASHLGSLATALSEQGETAQARQMLEETLTLYRALGNRGGLAWTLNSLAHLASEQDELPSARVLLEEALDINRHLVNRAGETWNLRSLGYLLVRLGEHTAAEAPLRQALVISEEIGDQAGKAWCRHGLGAAACARQDYEAAFGFERAALREMHFLGMKGGMMDVMESLANLSRLMGRPARAAAVLSAVDTARQSLGLPRPASANGWDADITDLLRRHLGEAAFDAAWAGGQAMAWEQAVEYALVDSG